MKIFIVALSSLVLLGCGQSSTESTQTVESFPVDGQVVLEGELVTESQLASSENQNPKRENIIETHIGEQTFNLEVSATREEREIGLMYRESMQYNEGMLFIFEAPARHRFWMKNTLIPLDILWLNEAKEIIHFETATPCYSEPCDIYGPEIDSLYVVELPAGSFVEEVGTVVEF